MAERLHKVLAQHGLGSRREIERWIVEGRLTLNGLLAKTGDAWTEGDKVQLDGRDVTRRLERKVAAQVLAYHKPQGQPIEANDGRTAVTTDEELLPAVQAEARRDVFTESVHSRLPRLRGSRWVPINPMHAGDSGLLLFTNDGALSYALTRQKKWIPTSYMVRVQVRGGLANAPELPATVTLDDGVVTFEKVAVVGDPMLEAEGESVSASGNVWYRVDMARADKRAAVRALFVSHNLSISRMMQVAFGPVSLTKEMPRGRHVVLDDKQLQRVYELAKLPLPVQPGVMTGKFSGKPLKRTHAKRSHDSSTEPARDNPRRQAGPHERAAAEPARRTGLRGRAAGASRGVEQGKHQDRAERPARNRTEDSRTKRTVRGKSPARSQGSSPGNTRTETRTGSRGTGQGRRPSSRRS